MNTAKTIDREPQANSCHPSSVYFDKKLVLFVQELKEFGVN
jgi:hypothetical protein